MRGVDGQPDPAENAACWRRGCQLQGQRLVRSGHPTQLLTLVSALIPDWGTSVYITG